MPFLRERNGKVHVFRNLEYYPTYRLFPKSVFEKAAPDLASIPRSAEALARSNTAMDLVESDRFTLLIIDGIAWMVWQFMKPGEYMEIYSG